MNKTIDVINSFPPSTKGFFSIIINILRGRSLTCTNVYSVANYLLTTRTSDLISSQGGS